MLILGVLLSGAALAITTIMYESATNIFGRKGRDVLDESRYRMAMAMFMISSVLLGLTGAAGYMQWLTEGNVTVRTITSFILAGGAFYLKVTIWNREKLVWTILSIAAIAIPALVGICVAAS